MSLLLKISGIILVLSGIMLVFKPDMVSSKPMPADAYQITEKRVIWGLLIGIGFFLFVSQYIWNYWGMNISMLLIALTLGVILARLIGMALDGFMAKQMLWLVIELTALLLFVFIYWKVKS